MISTHQAIVIAESGLKCQVRSMIQLKDTRFGQIECIASTPGFSDHPYLFVSLWVLSSEMWDDESEDVASPLAHLTVPQTPSGGGAAVKRLTFEETKTAAKPVPATPVPAGSGGGAVVSATPIGKAGTANSKRRLFYQLIPREVMALAPDTEVRFLCEGRMIHMGNTMRYVLDALPPSITAAELEEQTAKQRAAMAAADKRRREYNAEFKRKKAAASAAKEQQKESDDASERRRAADDALAAAEAKQKLLWSGGKSTSAALSVPLAIPETPSHIAPAVSPDRAGGGRSRFDLVRGLFSSLSSKFVSSPSPALTALPVTPENLVIPPLSTDTPIKPIVVTAPQPVPATPAVPVVTVPATPAPAPAPTVAPGTVVPATPAPAPSTTAVQATPNVSNPPSRRASAAGDHTSIAAAASNAAAASAAATKSGPSRPPAGYTGFNLSGFLGINTTEGKNGSNPPSANNSPKSVVRSIAGSGSGSAGGASGAKPPSTPRVGTAVSTKPAATPAKPKAKPEAEKSWNERLLDFLA